MAFKIKKQIEYLDLSKQTQVRLCSDTKYFGVGGKISENGEHLHIIFADLYKLGLGFERGQLDGGFEFTFAKIVVHNLLHEGFSSVSVGRDTFVDFLYGASKHLPVLHKEVRQARFSNSVSWVESFIESRIPSLHDCESFMKDDIFHIKRKKPQPKPSATLAQSVSSALATRK
jgi:hypothetical protein